MPMSSILDTAFLRLSPGSRMRTRVAVVLLLCFWAVQSSPQDHVDEFRKLYEVTEDKDGLDGTELELNWEIELKGDECFMEEEGVIIGEEIEEWMEER